MTKQSETPKQSEQSDKKTVSPVVVSFDDVRRFLSTVTFSSEQKPSFDKFVMPIRVTVKLDDKQNESIDTVKTYPQLAYDTNILGLFESLGLIAPRGGLQAIIDNVTSFLNSPYKAGSVHTRQAIIDANKNIFTADNVYMYVRDVTKNDGIPMILPAQLWANNLVSIASMTFVPAVSVNILTPKQTNKVTDEILVIVD